MLLLLPLKIQNTGLLCDFVRGFGWAYKSGGGGGGLHLRGGEFKQNIKIVSKLREKKAFEKRIKANISLHLELLPYYMYYPISL